MMAKLGQAKLLLDFYFAPWGAAKGEIWEDISNDSVFSDDQVTGWVQGILAGKDELTEHQIKCMKIVTG